MKNTLKPIRYTKDLKRLLVAYRKSETDPEEFIQEACEFHSKYKFRPIRRLLEETVDLSCSTFLLYGADPNEIAKIIDREKVNDALHLLKSCGFFR